MPTSPDDQSLSLRPIESDRAVAFQENVDYAFHPEDGPPDYDGPGDLPERQGQSLGVFAGDDLVASCTHYGFTARLRGEWVPLAGLAAVATPPEYRRQGYVRFMIEASLERWRRESPLAALWPFDRGYYEQFGWATATKRARYACPPEQLAFARERASGEFRRVEADDWEALVPAHEAHAAERDLTLQRDEEWWRERVFGSLGGDRPYVYAWERDGDVRGYVAYEFERDGDGLDDRRLAVRDLAYADREAHLNLLRFLSNHDSQASEVTLYGEATASLLDLVPDPSAVDCEVTAGPMVRIVDVVHALETLSYPDDVSETVALAVTDESAPWNDGTVRLRVDDGTGTVEAAPDAEPDVELDVGTLSQLAVGYHGVEEARRLAGLSVADEDAVATLSRLFPPRRPFLRTFF